MGWTLRPRLQKLFELPYIFVTWVRIVHPSMDEHEHFHRSAIGFKGLSNQSERGKRLALVEVCALVVKFYKCD